MRGLALSFIIWFTLFLFCYSAFAQVSLDDKDTISYRERTIELIPAFSRTCTPQHVCTATIRSGLNLNIKEDPEFPVNYVGFNGTHAELQLSADVKHKYTQIPLKSVVDSKETVEQDIVLTTKQIWMDDIKENVEVVDNPPIVSLDITKDYKWGYNSTTVHFNDNISDLLDDAEFDEDTGGQDGQEQTFVVDPLDGGGEVLLFKLNMSVIPIGSIISDFHFCFRTSTSGGTNNEIGAYFSNANQSWDERDIDSLCGDGAACSDLNQFRDTYLGNFTWNLNGTFQCANNSLLTQMVNASIGTNITIFLQDNSSFSGDNLITYSQEQAIGTSRPYFNVTYELPPSTARNDTYLEWNITNGSIWNLTNFSNSYVRYISENETTHNLNLFINSTLQWGVVANNNTWYAVSMANLTYNATSSFHFQAILNTTANYTLTILNVSDDVPAPAPPVLYHYLDFNFANESIVNLSDLQYYVKIKLMSHNYSWFWTDLYINGTYETSINATNSTWTSFDLINVSSVGDIFLIANNSLNTTNIYKLTITNTTGAPAPTVGAWSGEIMSIAIFLIGAVFILLYIGRTSQVDQIKLFLTMVAIISSAGLARLASLIASDYSLSSDIVLVIDVITIIFLFVFVIMLMYTIVMFIVYVLHTLASRKLEKDAPKLWSGKGDANLWKW